MIATKWENQEVRSFNGLVCANGELYAVQDSGMVRVHAGQESDDWLNVAILAQKELSGGQYMVKCGEALEHGSIGVVVLESLQNHEPIWTFVSEQSNPFDRIEAEGGWVRVLSTAGAVFRFSVPLQEATLQFPGPLSCIADVARAAPLFALYEQARLNPGTVSDQELLEQIEKTYWPTNAFCAVQQIFCIIAPACLLRPHLTRELLRAPIEAIIACGIEDSASVIEVGTYLLKDQEPYASPDRHGAIWLQDVLPTLGALADEVFADVLRECHE
ncbi:hypothetical protein [Pseudoduganella violacea]|uniref:Uncharacterized protein n=1 Tax=Pseudoduganella violacea TaxID=1715466 RepID=A0A7W5B5M5_9BURK|nr:hypothetical protein [Pseudoduganella violacea]MBB3117029.1 hypothetical protein [Pseudoduganella violacea]